MFQVLHLIPVSLQMVLLTGVCGCLLTNFFVKRTRLRLEAQLRLEESRREAAEGANRAKAFFLTSMSHEIRAPLNAILAFTDLAMKTPLSPQLRDHLATVRASADWLHHVVDEVVDFSRMEAGSMQLASEPFSLSEIARSAVHIAQPLVEQRKLLLRLHLDAALPRRVRGDGTRLLQVIFNLVENAAKSTPSGSILVTVTKEGGAADYVVVRISIADTGVGIAPERLRLLFEPLSSHSTSLDRRAQTCGFGLPICQRLVRMMGGEIEAQSRPGIGSTFAFSLSLPVVPDKVSSVETTTATTSALKRLAILLVDDDAEGRELTVVLLRGAGHFVTEASNGSEAVDLFVSSHFDLVLMDIEMPGLNGLDATKAIRATEPASRKIPIYALTAHVSDSDKRACLEAGMTGFLSKTLSQESLLNLAAATSNEPRRSSPSEVECGPSLELLSSEAI